MNFKYRYVDKEGSWMGRRGLLQSDLFPGEVYCNYESVLKAVKTCVMVFLTLCSLFWNPVRELFSSWRRRVCDCSSYERTTLLQALWSSTVHCSSRCWPRKETLKLSWPVRNEQPAMMNDDHSVLIMLFAVTWLWLLLFFF